MLTLCMIHVSGLNIQVNSCTYSCSRLTCKLTVGLIMYQASTCKFTVGLSGQTLWFMFQAKHYDSCFRPNIMIYVSGQTLWFMFQAKNYDSCFIPNITTHVSDQTLWFMFQAKHYDSCCRSNIHDPNMTVWCRAVARSSIYS